MPACRGLGRLIACDMIGMGDPRNFPTLAPTGHLRRAAQFSFALWEKLGLEKDVVFVLHDWGSLLGFDWTRSASTPSAFQGNRLHGGACSAYYLGGLA